MTDHIEDDEVLARELAEALRPTLPFTGGVAARAKGAFAWRTIDQDLLTAVLLFDSARHGDRAQTRDPGGHRVLVFSAELRSVEIEVLADRVVGQFTPQSAGTVEVESGDGVSATVAVDDLGFFVIEPVPRGVIRLRCSTPSTRLVTDWITL